MNTVTSQNPFAADLLAWYDHAAADLAWRRTKNPYHIWLSEIMLQQTQVETVKPYFERFTSAFPTVSDLAAAPLDQVLKLWEGLGYYARARNMHKAAQLVAGEYAGVFPQTVEGLLTLAGVGRYTAGAIASIAFEVRAPVLDGNVIRVFARLLDLTDDVSQAGTQAKLWRVAEDWLPDGRYGDYNQALMELGRVICKPRNPLCAECPIRAACKAYAHGTQAERPVKKAKAPTPHYDVSAGIVYRGDGKILIAQRPNEGLLGGLWEFPGGKQEADETLTDCLKRELLEELGITVRVGDLFVKVAHAFTHFKITLHAFTCQLEDSSAAPQTIEAQAWAWVTLDEMAAYSFGKADRVVIEALQARRDMLF